jgi:uncharacterized protein (DUF1800 family)
MRKILGALVVLSLGILPAAARKNSKAHDDYRTFQVRLSKDQQVLQALDRLTFGPRPGDVQRVQHIGLKKWIDRQLHPDRIRESPELETRLHSFDSLSMSPAEAVRHYPTPGMIQAIAMGRQPMPDDPVLRAGVQRIVAQYKARKDAAGINASAELEPARPLEDVLDREQIRILRSGTPPEKQQLLSSLSEDALEGALIAMPRPMRQNLIASAPEEARRKILLLNAPQQVISYDLNSGKLLRAVYSDRQVQEVLTDFWYNHFNVFLDKGADRFLVPTYERESIRPYVLGKFRDLLEATAKSPAMLFYLDNWQSAAPNPRNPNRPKQARRGLNENYARELLELHTMGVDGGYTQKDIIEVARCFTGWTIKAPQKGGGFEYNDKVHDKGEKIVLGHVIPAGGGMGDGEKVLDILAHHPSTARFIAASLARRFVADNPPPRLIDRMADRFRKTDGDIRSVLKTMLDSKEFWSQGAYRAKVKTPFEMIVSSLRALDAQVENTIGLAKVLADLGQPLYRKLEPTGYSTLNAEWVNSASLLARMNFALALVQNKVPGVKIDMAQFGTVADIGGIARAVLFRDLTPETTAALENAVREQQLKQTAPATPALVAGLVIGSPDFQRR